MTHIRNSEVIGHCAFCKGDTSQRDSHTVMLAVYNHRTERRGIAVVHSFCEADYCERAELYQVSVLKVLARDLPPDELGYK